MQLLPWSSVCWRMVHDFGFARQQAVRSLICALVLRRPRDEAPDAPTTIQSACALVGAELLSVCPMSC